MKKKQSALKRCESSSKATVRTKSEFKKLKNEKFPRLQNVRILDLRSPTSLEAMRLEAIQLKIIDRSEFDRMRFYSLAANALRVGKKPAALFASNLYNRNFDLVGASDEAKAQAMIKGFDRGRDTEQQH